MPKKESYILAAEQISQAPIQSVGKKAKNLQTLTEYGFKVPAGVCLSPLAYETFINTYHIDELISKELNRKRFHRLRWEEMWDAAFRIRHAFVCQEIPDVIKQQILAAIKQYDLKYPLAVRSATTREDSEYFSFAGLHSTVIDVRSETTLFESIIKVWSSLWSDSVLLYQHVLKQDPHDSKMAILIQEMVHGAFSGVTFTADPNDLENHDIRIEVVPGDCSNLVSGATSPFRWVIDRQGDLKDYQAPDPAKKPLLKKEHIGYIAKECLKIENILNVPVDIEWVYAKETFYILQARQITTGVKDKDDELRRYFLALTPNLHRLRKLSQRVTEKLIPKLKETGDKMAAEEITQLDNRKLATAIVNRYNALQDWRVIYRNNFVPFGHGVRNLGVFYNDVVKPDDPYEFVHILGDEKRIAALRNEELKSLIDHINKNNYIHAIKNIVKSDISWDEIEKLATPDTKPLFEKLIEFRYHFLETTYLSENLDMQPQLFLKILLSYCKHDTSIEPNHEKAQHYINKLLNAVPKEFVGRAKEYIQIAQLSWRLRDDDNILLGRLTNYTLKGIAIGVERLQQQGRLKHAININELLVYDLVKALRDDDFDCNLLGLEEKKTEKKVKSGIYQLRGQPACPGIVTGPARCLHKLEDISKVKPGEIIVCDGVDPGMTLIMPLCAGIVEMRGGMLIHGVIIARELGLPCVTGVLNALHIAKTGDLITLNGDKGIVTINRL